MKILVTATMLALVPLALSAAEQDSTHHGHLLKRWDTNGDSVVTKDEAEAAAAQSVGKRFDAFDLNKDGQLTQEELDQVREKHRAAMHEKMESRFKQADKNSDGALSKEEAQTGLPMLARRYDKVDQNKDGLVTPEELQAHHQARHSGKTQN